MIKLDLDRFQPVRLEDQEEIRSFLLKCDYSFCDYSYVNLFIWGEIYQMQWQISEARLWIYSPRLQRMPLPPGESVIAADLRGVADSFRERGIGIKFGLVHEKFLESNPDTELSFDIVSEPQNADYIYSTRKMIELKGNKLAKKKNLITQFQRLYPEYRSRPLEEGDSEQCLRLAEKWCRVKSCDQVGYSHESSALRRALDNFKALRLEGVKISLAGEMIAFSIISPFNQNTADVHFEKSDPLVKGSAQMINWETARNLDGRFEWINREQDLGIPGLRQAKRSYSPEMILMPFLLEPKKSSF